jgi:multicomponent K+:H+ antiporter subunit G
MILDAIVALLLVASGLLAFTAALGLVRLKDFFLRMHAPSLAITLGSWAVTLASVVYFSTSPAGLSLHVWLIIILLAITAPVTTVLLARAGLFRQRRAGDDLPPPLWTQDGGGFQPAEDDATVAGVPPASADRTSGRH